MATHVEYRSVSLALQSFMFIGKSRLLYLSMWHRRVKSRVGQGSLL